MKSIADELENREIPICQVCKENPQRQGLKTCSIECSKIYSKECKKKYLKTDKSKEYQKEYRKTDKYKEYSKRYQKTEKYKKYRREYYKNLYKKTFV